MYLDYCYNNAVVHTFVHVLQGGSSLRGVASTAHKQLKEDYIVNPHVMVTSKHCTTASYLLTLSACAGGLQ